ncbi:hypothetical protein PIB30_070622 [Stylosanthes scabra]|uniref:Uncharacterized protein n=1 Tax=Stylosanthes scabra TaxID=79078 RepID=A0ABU6SP37_9FABA|nr:hypothetical protein [Stylosanthes scabra]
MRTRIGRNDEEERGSSVPTLWYEGMHGDMQQFSKWFQAYVNDPANMVTDPLLVNLAFGPNLEYTSWTQMKVSGMKFQTNDNSRGRTTDNTGVYLKGDAGQGECDCDDEGAVDEGSSDDNESASAESISTEYDE